jgi:hypothetical protein
MEVLLGTIQIIVFYIKTGFPIQMSKIRDGIFFFLSFAIFFISVMQIKNVNMN